MTYATFILSTGRCGTQWLASALADAYPDALAVEHEPLHNSYRPRQLLRALDPRDTDDPAIILNHADAIERRLATASYLECGHPCWAAIPFFARRFEGRVRVVHLTRHPVPTACSWVTHGCYSPPLLPGIHPEKVPLAPTDASVQFPHYRDAWPTLTPFEKCLYYWLEVNAFGLRHEVSLGVPWLRLSYEELFGGDGLSRLLAFLGLEPTAALAAQRPQHVDRFCYVAGGWWDVRAVERHADVLALAARLGYDARDVDDESLRRRYLAGPPPAPLP